MKKLFLILILLLSISGHSQQKKAGNKNPILFLEFMLGSAREFKPKSGGLLTGFTFKNEVKGNLYAIRFLKRSKLRLGVASALIPVPYVKRKKTFKEIGLLYGRKWNFYDGSISISGGVSFNRYIDKMYLKKNQTTTHTSNNIGLPLEVNLKFFKGRKKRFRAFFGLIPMGKPTNFGRSIGVKLVANISKYNFIGLAVTYGFGNHKRYN